MPPALLSRTLDPILGVFTGVFAYYLYEINPRSGIAQGDRLSELTAWRWAKWRNERRNKLSEGGEEEALDAIKKEVEKERE
ncbi:uncharacterized protein FIBRA_06788 [Fibroporia radiculosa]|uniref:Non-classical export protein 1 n=1 Tax=Fibroporia radiculosa TaxID=599839 RepID=J4IBG2_9APHY|nr:uncharacterized protein FIBRA_06788 [Fibroporia radiculosa]CCM04606.1 predicted protein [Fibroporia radiculosa]